MKTVDDLLKLIDEGGKPEYVFFWGHSPSKDGSVNKSCFSQWWDSPFTVDDVWYATAEHWMMACKGRHFGDEETLKRILMTNDPYVAKKLGRQVKKFDKASWDASCFNYVVQGNVHKFSQHPALKKFLLSQEGKIIVEASPYDEIWGIGLKENDPLATKPAQWPGKNLLGFALMEALKRLKEAA